MTTASWSTRVRHDSDATYQEWRDEFITKLGLMTTLVADETNITPGAGARASTNAEQGYAVYHLNDSLHGTAPIYIRFGFGTLSNSAAPRIQITVGTSTNGSGVLGGTALSTITSVHQLGVQSSDTPRQSYMCAAEGFFGFWWKVGSGGSEASFFICRTCDSTGAPTATGSMVHWGGGANTAITKRQAFRYASPAAAYTAQTAAVESALTMSPQSPTSTSVSGDIQVMLCWTITPRVAPLFGVCGIYASEIAGGNTFTATLVGTTPRTYLAWGGVSGPAWGVTGAITSAGYLCLAMLWE